MKQFIYFKMIHVNVRVILILMSRDVYNNFYAHCITNFNSVSNCLGKQLN